MISINWQQVAAYLLLGGSGLSGLIYAAIVAWRKLRNRTPSTTEIARRSADEPAPNGAVEWVADIVTAMGTASAESKLIALRAGSNRDQARSLRISELEAKP